MSKERKPLSPITTQVCIWLDNQMAPIAVKVCPNNTLKFLIVKMLCKGTVLFPILLLPFDSVFLSSSPFIIHPCLLSAWSSSRPYNDHVKNVHTIKVHFCAFSRSLKQHGNWWKGINFPSFLLVHLLLTSPS